MLITLALMMASAGALRLGSGVGVAVAGDRVAEASPDVPPPACPAPPLALAEALDDRDKRVTEREKAVAARMAALDLADKAVSARMAELQQAEKDLEQLVSLADGAAEDDLGRLTAVYEAMKPSDAARLFAAMSPDFAAGFLARMKPPSAAAVLSGMAPEAAFAVSVLIAGRNARAPTD